MCGFFFICRDAAQGNTGEGEEVEEAAVVEECTKVIRSCVSFDILEDESGDSSSDSGDNEAGDGVVWATSGVQAEAYRKRMLIWKNEIKAKGQVFASVSEVKISIWKYAIANHFEYRYVRNCQQRIAVKCTAEGCGFYICVRGHLKRGGMYVKEFELGHVHSVGAECQMGKWGRRRMQASLLGTLIEGNV